MTCQLRLAAAVVLVDSICMTMIFAIQRMSQAYCIIFLNNGYMVADMSDIESEARELFISNISSKHPVCHVDLDELNESLTMLYQDNMNVLPHDETNVEVVVDVCNLIMKKYSEDSELRAYPLQDLVGVDMNTSMLDLDLDRLNERIEQKSSTDISSFIDRLDDLEENVNKLSEIVKRLALQYGILTHST